MQRPSVILFDIDDTLLTTGGAGRRALERAFTELYGEGEWMPFALNGMTDQAIVRSALEQAGQPASDPAIARVLQRYLRHLEPEVLASPRYVIYPGVRAVLEQLARDPARVAVGLGTGNVARGAAIKLARGGLGPFFRFGGFGSDHEQRSELLRIGAERGAAALGMAAATCRVVVVGDTPRDVAAGQAIGAECIGVATGVYSVAQLQESGAQRVFVDLQAPGVLAALQGAD